MASMVLLSSHLKHAGDGFCLARLQFFLVWAHV